MKTHSLRPAHLLLFILIITILAPFISAHETGGTEAFVRVVSADPAARTYTIACEASPNNGELRDFFIRPDNGEFSESVPNEAESLDRAAGNHFTHTFQQDKFYHIGCIIVNSSNVNQQWRGDLHLDLRNAPWNPNIVPVSWSGKTATLSCQYNGGSATYTWDVIDARTGQYTSLGAGQEKTFTAPAHGLYDFICHVQTGTGQTFNVPFPVEFFDQGDPYFADKQGVPQGVTSAWVRGSTPGNTTTPPPANTTNTSQPPAGQTCVNTVQNIPATCTGGSITADSYNGCRQISCSGATGSVQVLACDKPDGSASPARVEMYKQASTGAPPTVCLGSACISTNGFAQASYPVCTSAAQQPTNTTNTTAPPTNQTNTTQPPGANATNTTGACYTNVKLIPAQCNGGILTQDTILSNSCRSLTCSGTGSGLQVLACDKPTPSSPQYFEMYKQTVAGSGPLGICIGSTCITMSGGGYAKSANYPVCVGNTTAPPGNTTPPPPPPPPPNTTNTTPPGNTTGACYNNVLGLPASCTGGSITQDTYNGCRSLSCAGTGGSVSVLACDKPDGSSSPTKFEMYKQSQTGTAPKLCLASTCISDNGYASAGYPVCVGNVTTPPTNATNGTNTTQPPANATNGTNTTSPPSQTMCYNSLQSMPVSCAGGAFTTDSFNGCRQLVCSSATGSLSVLACEKPSNSNAEYFEMYKQSQTGTGVTRICIASTCIEGNGYAQSGHYPLCMAVNSTNGTGNGTGGGTGGNTTPQLFAWIEPTEGQTNTPPNFFHFNIQVPSNEAQIPSTTWEVWNQAESQRVWAAQTTGNLRFHTHTPDGAFEGPLAGQMQLGFLTTYKARVRYNYQNGTQSPWSSWRTFTTSAQQAGGATLWTAAPGFTVERFATGFDVPVHVAFAPPGMYNSVPESQRPYLYVTELYGQVKVVTRNGTQSVYAQDLLNFEPFGSITGGGQMGVIGLYVDDVTGDLFVGTTYVDNGTVKNKIVRFVSTDDGRSHTSQQTIISNLPSAPSHQIEQITKGPDGKLYVGLGDALNEQNAQSDTVLAGKILRMNMDGSNVEVYAKGLRNPFGADWRPGAGVLYATDNSPNTNDRLLRIDQGENYLWGTGTNAYVGKAIDLLNPSPVDLEFNPGNTGFPVELNGRMYVAVAGPIYQQGPTNGKEILEYTLNAGGNITAKRQFVVYTGTGYGTPMGLDFGPDGLYFTDIYGEPGFVGLGKTEGNIYRIVPGTPNGTGTTTGPFRAGISIIPWYPKDTGYGIEYIFECQGIDGSGSYKYDYSFGNGQQQINYDANRVGPVTYPYGNKNYTVSCTAKDQVSGQQASASMIINPSTYLPPGT